MHIIKIYFIPIIAFFFIGLQASDLCLISKNYLSSYQTYGIRQSVNFKIVDNSVLVWCRYDPTCYESKRDVSFEVIDVKNGTVKQCGGLSSAQGKNYYAYCLYNKNTIFAVSDKNVIHHYSVTASSSNIKSFSGESRQPQLFKVYTLKEQKSIEKLFDNWDSNEKFNYGLVNQKIKIECTKKYVVVMNLSGGIVKFDIDETVNIVPKSKVSLSIESITSMTLDKNNRLFVGNKAGRVIRYDLDQETLQSADIFNLKKQICSIDVCDNNIALIIGSSDDCRNAVYDIENQKCLFSDEKILKEMFIYVNNYSDKQSYPFDIHDQLSCALSNSTLFLQYQISRSSVAGAGSEKGYCVINNYNDETKRTVFKYKKSCEAGVYFYSKTEEQMGYLDKTWMAGGTKTYTYFGNLRLYTFFPSSFQRFKATLRGMWKKHAYIFYFLAKLCCFYVFIKIGILQKLLKISLLLLNSAI